MKRSATTAQRQVTRRTTILIVAGLLLTTLGLQAQEARVSAYFQKIRKNEAALTAFISQMPKGGDLHNHYTGAIYAETYIDWLLESDYCVNPQTLEIAQLADCSSASFITLSELRSKDPNGFESFKGKLIRFWSTKDYDQLHDDAREEHFFAAFGKFGPVSGSNYRAGLQELKKRAKAENISYIELMLPGIKLKALGNSTDLLTNRDTIQYYNELLTKLGQSKDTVQLQSVLQYLYSKTIQDLSVNDKASSVNHLVDSLHQHYVAGDSAFTMRYLAFVQRTMEPVTVFANLVTAFETVNQSTSGNLVGLNFVAPEDHTVAMRDYWLHMHFFRFCKVKYANVKYSLHAGELTGGLVKPEELTWHISAAVYNGGTDRIGHGVDIPYEKDSYILLKYMSNNNVAIEINLISNEFILGVKDSKHPVLLYHRFNVPIVISTDDPGISRTSLTEQYVVLAQRYPEIRYRDIKRFAMNSIEYSFIKEQEIKENLKKDLTRRFLFFEKYILSNK